MCTRMLGEPRTAAASTHCSRPIPRAPCIKRILAVPGIDRDIHHGGSGLRDRFLQFVEIFRLKRRKNRAPQLNLADVELLGNVRGRIP